MERESTRNKNRSNNNNISQLETQKENELESQIENEFILKVASFRKSRGKYEQGLHCQPL
jgi:hypothetical protein